MDGKIYITISDKRSEAGNGVVNTEPTQNKPQKRATLPAELKVDINENLDAGIRFLQHEMIHFAKQQASQFASYSIQNIGNFTGNYQAQRDVQNSLNIANMMSNIAMTGLSVAVTTGSPVLGGFAAAVAVGSYVINYDRQEKLNSFLVKKQNREVAILRDISGLNSLTNGGRI